MGHTHAASGAAAFLALTPLAAHVAAPLTPAQTAAGAVLAAGAGITPDLDHSDASAAHTYGPPTRVIAAAIGWISGGHRNGTHSILGVAVFTAAAYAATLHPAGTVIAVALLTGFGLKALAPIHWTARVAAGAGAAALTWWFPGLAAWPVLPLAVAVGCAAHIAGDILTRPGCPLLWPASQGNTSIPLVDTDGWSEKWVVTPFVGVATIGLTATTFAPILTQ